MKTSFVNDLYIFYINSFKKARKNREIALLQRKIDEVPSRAELSQYQRRFVELYNQVSSTHRETKQFYTLYNTLDDAKRYISKEVSIVIDEYYNLSFFSFPSWFIHPSFLETLNDYV